MSAEHAQILKRHRQSHAHALRHDRAGPALLQLPGQIPVLRSIEVGLNDNPAESWDVVLTAVVDKMTDVEVYAKHPAHVAAASLLGANKELRACVDYEC